jgi:hypothetical protein
MYKFGCSFRFVFNKPVTLALFYLTQVFPLGYLQDGLGGEPFVNMQGHGINHAPLLLPLARPFQPGFMV